MCSLYEVFYKINNLRIKPEQAYEELVEKALNNEAHQEKYIPDWPKKGEIEFKNYTVMYRANLAPALKDLSFSIAPR